MKCLWCEDKLPFSKKDFCDDDCKECYEIVVKGKNNLPPPKE